MRSSLGLPLLCLSAVLTSSCAGLSNVSRADTLGKGNGELTLEPGAWVMRSETNGTYVVPHLDASMHYGLTDRFDIGGRVGFSLVELHAKLLLTTPGDQRLAISLAPTVGGLAVGTPVLGLLNLDVPLLIGIKHGNGNELIFGPRVHNWIGFGSGTSGGYLAPGLSVGYAWQITEIFGLLPEASVVVPVTAWGGADMSTFNALVGNHGAPMFSFKLGVFFGRNRTAPPKGPKGPRQPAFPAEPPAQPAPAPANPEYPAPGQAAPAPAPAPAP